MHADQTGLQLETSLDPEQPYVLHPDCRYPTVYGKATLTGLTFADFSGTRGPGGCSSGQWALANHVKAADAFHPHYFAQSNRVNVSDAGLMRLIGPDPSWRNPSDCDDVMYKSPADGSSFPLNCQVSFSVGHSSHVKSVS